LVGTGSPSFFSACELQISFRDGLAGESVVIYVGRDGAERQGCKRPKRRHSKPSIYP